MKEQKDKVSGTGLTDDERISAYMRREMSAVDEAAFMDDLNHDAELRDTAVMMGFMVKAVNEVGEQKDQRVKDALMAIDRESGRRLVARALRRPRVAAVRTRVIRMVAVAASLLVLVTVGYQYHGYRQTTRLGEQYATVFADQQTQWRGDTDEKVEKELTALYANVQGGNDLDATIRRLSVLWELSTMDTYNDYSDYAPMIGWNLAIACLKDNDRKSAREVLTKLVGITKPQSIVNKKAKELLGEIR